MKISTVAIVILWLFFVINGVISGVNLPADGYARSMSETDNWTIGAMLAMPLVPVLLSFRTVYAPWPWRSVTAFLIRLKIELLFAAYGLLYGVVGLVRSIQLGGPRGAYVVGGFFVSAGVGCLCSHLILHRRGLLRPDIR
jgi:hypothetical protein